MRPGPLFGIGLLIRKTVIVTETSALLPAPRFTDPTDAPSLRWGVIAPGEIANDFVDALRAHTNQRVVAVGSRSSERAERFAARHGVPKAYNSYEQLVTDPDVDVVYVASPHSEHAAHALLAIAAGKHVLVEKPIALTAAEATTIADAARRAGVFAMEAMWTRYLPQTDIARQLLADGALGEPRIVTADFGFAGQFDPASRLFDRALAGGALLDVGVYVVSWASFAIGAPDRVYATGTLAPTGVDDQVSLLLATSSGAQALLSTGLRVNTPSLATIAGTLGRIETDTPFWAPSGIRYFGADGSLVGHWVDPFGRPHRQGMCYEAAALARFVDDGLTESPLHPLDESISTLATIDEARRQVGYPNPGSASE